MRWLALLLIPLGLTAREETAPMAAGNVILEETFDATPDGELPAGWWVEGGEKVEVRDGRLHIKSDPAERSAPGFVCTVWNETELPGDVRVEFDAEVTGSSFAANNINFFLLYSMPDGASLYETRDERADADYRKYHDLNGYIFTYLNDYQAAGGKYEDGTTKARFRMRKCPGFKLVDETFDYRNRLGEVYRVMIEKRGGKLTFSVDGTCYLSWEDETPYTSGLLAFRTFHTDLACDNLKVTALGEGD